MDEPVLLFGLGAPKSGTSWLYGYLAAHPDCHLRSIKELHFFDSIDLDNVDWQLKDFGRMIETLERRLEEGGVDDELAKALQLADLRIYVKVLKKADLDGYLGFLSDGVEKERVVGDLTPSYCLLSADRLAQMARLSGKVRFVYLMRDPVDRLWSHVRMIAARRSKTGADIAERATWIFDRTLAGGEDHILARGDYRVALEKLQAAVAPDQVFVCAYEDLFTSGTVDRLCDFLGIEPLPGDFDRPVNAGVPVKMSRDQRRRASDFLRPQYDFVAARMGQLPAAWEANRAGM